MVSLLLLVGPITTAVIVVVYVVALRTRHHYTSMLACPHCNRSFEYNWVPLASFTAVRLGKNRYLKCPLCQEWARFDIWATRKGR